MVVLTAQKVQMLVWTTWTKSLRLFDAVKLYCGINARENISDVNYCTEGLESTMHL